MEKTITKIEVQKKNPNRVSIFLDYEYTFSCSAELVFSHKLKAGKKVEIDKLKEIIEEDSYLCCKNDALRAIERSYKSEKQIFDKLINKGYEEQTIKKTLEFLKNYSFVDDSRYADLYIKEKIRSQGKNKIKYSLLRKGIDEKLLKEKLNAVDSEIEYNSAKMLAEKKYKVLQKTERDTKKQYKKLGDFLMRNGFDTEIINSIVKKIVVNQNDFQDEEEKDTEELIVIAQKRFNVLIKSESDERKLYKKLSDYLMRRGYKWDDIKIVLKEVLKRTEFDEE